MKGVKGVKVYRNSARTGGVQRSRTFTPYTHQPDRQVRGVTAVQAAIGRAALILVSLAAALWTAYGPQGAWTLAWTGVVFVVVSCAVLAWSALQPKGDGDG